MACKYLSIPEEVFTVDPFTGTQTAAEAPDSLRLCTWADDSSAGVKALTGAPRWLQREALGGHLWRKGDCDGCPGFCQS